MNRNARAPLVGTFVLSVALAGCSSSGSSPTAVARTTSTGSRSTAGPDAAQTYLDSVNALCDALLPKIVAATHGGSIDVPARKYLATWPAHKRLLNAFDANLSKVFVPDAARGTATTLAAYVRFADRLDQARLTAAHTSQAAYAKEVQSESGVENDPAITALIAAGFHQSCTAR